MPVYVLAANTAMAAVLADKLVAWAAASELRSGLLALIEDGTAADCEMLLAVGSTMPSSRRSARASSRPA